MIIRKMNLEDGPQVAAIERLCFSAPWNENMIISSWESRLSCWLIAEIDGCVAGYVGSEAVLDSADMMNTLIKNDQVVDLTSYINSRDYGRINSELPEALLLASLEGNAQLRGRRGRRPRGYRMLAFPLQGISRGRENAHAGSALHLARHRGLRVLRARLSSL